MRLLSLLLAVASLGCTACGGADPRGAHVERIAVHSALVGRTLEQIRITPAQGDRRFVLVFLHGRTDDLHGPDSVLSDELFAGLAALGRHAPTVLVLNGGAHSYFHDRRGGAWGRYVLEEALPRLGVRPGDRVALGGVSMGGFGALHLARARRLCAVGAHSPALWLRSGDSAPGAFDDAEDFARNGRPGAPRAPMWLDVGDRDPFRGAVTAYARRVGARLQVWPGQHGWAYWRAHMGAYLRFYARACSPPGS